VDTAGRLHTKHNLMRELEKVRDVLRRAVHEAPHQTLLVIDATNGQNAINQARGFAEAVGVTGVILTKLDGTPKGGVAFAIAGELGIPIRYLGTGEKIDDLEVFDAQAFVDELLGD
jgi:fused signal recognition particle receptor